jgi:hypothetical protein
LLIDPEDVEFGGGTGPTAARFGSEVRSVSRIRV